MGEVVEARRRAPQKSVVREAFRRGWPSVCDWVPKRVRREALAYERCGDAPALQAALLDGEAAESCSSGSSCGWCGRCARPKAGSVGPLGGGAVVVTQWFGSSLQVTPHLHGRVAEALWTPGGELVELPAPDTAFRRGDPGAGAAGRAEGLRGPGSSVAFPTSTRLRSVSRCNGPWGSSCHRHHLAGGSRSVPGFRCTRTPRCTAMTDKALSACAGMEPADLFPSPACVAWKTGGTSTRRRRESPSR